MRFTAALFLVLFLLPALAQAQWKESTADQPQESKAIEDYAASQTAQKILRESGVEQGDEARYDCSPFGGAFYTRDRRSHAEILAAAEAGNATSQQGLGMMYQSGSGVPHNNAEAVKWFRRAADQALGGAFGSLGEIYSEGGCGVTQDYPEAYFWFSLADNFEKIMAEKYHTEGVHITTYPHEERDNAAAHLSPQQKAEVEKRVEDWIKTHPTPSPQP